MSDELKEIAQQVAAYNALLARVTRWGDEADRLLRTDNAGQAHATIVLLREIAEVSV